eukprot:52865-Eustigmatos_ZCMA.PRE.1
MLTSFAADTHGAQGICESSHRPVSTTDADTHRARDPRAQLRVSLGEARVSCQGEVSSDVK